MYDDPELLETIEESIEIAESHSGCDTTRSLCYAMAQTCTLNAMMAGAYKHMLAAHLRVLALCCTFHQLDDEASVELFRKYLAEVRKEDGNAPSSGRLQ